jgi:hypothetical protein
LRESEGKRGSLQLELLMQADAHPGMSQANMSHVTASPATESPPAAAKAHHHATAHHHAHAVQYSTVSLLGASVFTRLAIVAGVAVILWCAIAWALA